MLHHIRNLTAVLGVCIGTMAGAEPARLPPPPPESNNQRIATTIAEQLRKSELLRGYKIDIVFQKGTAEVRGFVSNTLQREEALKTVRGVPGVQDVRDRLIVLPPAPVIQAQAKEEGPKADGPKPQPLPAGPMPRLVEQAPILSGPPPGPPDPVPVYTMPFNSPYHLTPPRLPPYAWPTYAPHNNYSRVGTPLAYPYNAWPFIGPQYPFPKVPLGWRSVQLEWVDGHWWFSKLATKHDWWRLRYW